MELPTWFLIDEYPYSPNSKYWASMIDSRMRIREKLEAGSDCRLEIRRLLQGTYSGEPYSIYGAWEPVMYLQHQHLRTLRNFAENSEEFHEREEVAFNLLDARLDGDDNSHDFMKVEMTTVDVHEGLSSELHGYTPLLVDFSQDRASIIESLDRLIQQNDELPKNKLGEKEFRLWHKYKVLPYFDLVNFSPAFGRKFSDKDISSLFWPEEDLDPAERLSKTTKKYLKRMFSKKTIRRLF